MSENTATAAPPEKLSQAERDASDVRSMIRVALGPVLAMVPVVEDAAARPTRWTFDIPLAFARLATEARAKLVELEPQYHNSTETEFHKAEALLSSMSALALMTDHEDAHCEAGPFSQSELYRASKEEIRADLITLTSLARELWGGNDQEIVAAMRARREELQALIPDE